MRRPKTTRETKVCLYDVCSRSFMQRDNRHIFCTKSCSNNYHKKEKNGVKDTFLSKGSIGAVGELRVATELLSKGFDVFRAVSQSATCDLIAVKDNRMIRLEVRTGSYTVDGRVNFPKKKKDTGRSEHYAVVLPDKIQYIPEL